MRSIPKYYALNSNGSKSLIKANSLQEAKSKLPKNSILLTESKSIQSLKESIKKMILQERSKADSVKYIDIDLTGNTPTGQNAGSGEVSTPAMPDVGTVSKDKDVQKVYSKLVDAYNEVISLNDEKLTQQMANLITYFNKNIVLAGALNNQPQTPQIPQA